MKSLYEQLLCYSRNDVVPMHMPGHKRNPAFIMENPYSFDVTEVEGTDDLHHPEGILKEAMEKAADLFGASRSIFLVGGSTSGILTAVSACCKREGHILMARNCHKSVYHAAYLLNLTQSYLSPEFYPKIGIFGEITVSQVKRACEENEEIDCVVITSPTYEGIVSPVREISRYLHQKKIPLIVDEAHGAHLHFQKSAPESAVTGGADIVVQSLHKTLPALTQTGLLHINQTGLVSVSEVLKNEQIYQTSSPSYVLMASIGQCLSFLETSEKAFSQYDVRIRAFYDRIKGLRHIRVLEKENKDPGKVVIIPGDTGLSGLDIMKILREDFQIELELAKPGYALAMTSVADKPESFERLWEALESLDKRLEKRKRNTSDKEIAEKNDINGNRILLKREVYDVPEAVLTAYTADKAEKIELPLDKAADRIAGEYVYLYPPGIPYLVPGEKITKDMVSLLLRLRKQGFSLRGMKDKRGQMIWVVK